MKTTDRFKTAADYVAAHPWANTIDAETRDALISILKKRKGVWSVRATAPKEPASRAAWEAYRDVRHARSWGYLPSAGSYSKIAFFMQNHDQQDRYSRLFDSFIELAKQMGARK